MDPNREIRAMIMLCLPTPPMPMLVSRCIVDETSYVCTEQGAGNSHDLIAHLMEIAAHTQSAHPSMHEARRARQEAAFKRLLDSLDAVKNLEKGVDYFYAAMAEFTRQYISSYLSPNVDHDIRFLPPCQVHVGTKIHRAAVDFVKAQSIMDGIRAIMPLEVMEYGEIICLVAKRLQEAA